VALGKPQVSIDAKVRVDAPICVGNGDPSSHEPDKDSKRRVFNGLCQAIVQASKDHGELKIEAPSPGLEPASVSVTCEPAQHRPAVL
jgi:beta-galactosidase